MSSPGDILNDLYRKVSSAPDEAVIGDATVLERIEYVCRCLSNRAGVRLLMACMLGKIHRQECDPRQPYIEIGGDESFSGRTLDERYIANFITTNHLPCNSTTAFLTPALRNIDRPLTTDVVIVGRPPRVYSDTLQILDDVANSRVAAEDVLADTIRLLILVREEKKARMATLVAGIEESKGGLPLSSECIVNLIGQHFACKHASRLPVLAVAAAYNTASACIGEFAKPLHAHNAADGQTGALGDVEICLQNDENVVTSYEMKMKRVTIEDIDRAVAKIASHNPSIDNYVFITTDTIDIEVSEYAASMYEKLSGTEVVVLDCVGFLRHFLHFFHRLRIEFLDAYQMLVLGEPDSAVRQPLKEASFRCAKWLSRMNRAYYALPWRDVRRLACKQQAPTSENRHTMKVKLLWIAA